MAATIVGTNVGNADIDTSLAITKPAGTVDGDVVVAVLVNNAATARDWNIPAGWSLCSEQLTGALDMAVMWHKVASDGASYTFTAATSSDLVGTVTTLRNVDADWPFGEVKFATSGTAPAITTNTDSRTCIVAYASDSLAELTSPTGTTELAEHEYANVGLNVAEFTQATAGSTGTKAFTDGDTPTDAVSVNLSIINTGESYMCDGDSTASPYRAIIDIDKAQLLSGDLDWGMLRTEFMPDGFRDSDEATAIASGGATARLSLYGDGRVRKGIDIIKCVPNTIGSNAEIQIPFEDPAWDNLKRGQHVFVFWGGSGNTQPAASATYGSESVYPTSNKASLPLQDNADDRTSNAHDGTITGPTSTTARILEGYDFDGSNDYISLGTQLGKPASGTIMLWMNPDAWGQADFRSLASSGAAGTAFGLRMKSSGKPQIHTSNGSSFAFTDVGTDTWNSTNYPSGTWVHVAATWDGSTLKFYKDGAGHGSASQTVANSGTAYGLSIGRNGEHSSNYFNGQVDEFHFFDDDMSANYIADYVSMTKSGSTLMSAGAVTDNSGGGGGGASTQPSALLLFA